MSIKRFGKKNSFILGSVLLLFVTFTVWLLDEKSPLWQLYAVAAAFGVGLGAALLIASTMLPDIIVEAAVKDDGVRREALFYSYFPSIPGSGVIRWRLTLAPLVNGNRYDILISKVAAGISIFLSNIFLEEYGGYDSESDDNSQAAPALLLLMTAWPAALMGVGLICSFMYPLTSEHVEANKDRLRQILETKAAESKHLPDEHTTTNDSTC